MYCKLFSTARQHCEHELSVSLSSLFPFCQRKPLKTFICPKNHLAERRFPVLRFSRPWAISCMQSGQAAESKLGGQPRRPHSSQGWNVPMKKHTSRKKILERSIWEGTELWTVHHGTLAQASTQAFSLFKVIGEKLPWDCLSQINLHLRDQGHSRVGVYVAHDADGYPRYVGRGF